MIFLSSPLFKHEGFRREEECCFVEHLTGNIKKVHYRERNGIILPYIKYKMVDRNWWIEIVGHFAKCLYIKLWLDLV